MINFNAYLLSCFVCVAITMCSLCYLFYLQLNFTSDCFSNMIVHLMDKAAFLLSEVYDNSPITRTSRNL